MNSEIEGAQGVDPSKYHIGMLLDMIRKEKNIELLEMCALFDKKCRELKVGRYAVGRENKLYNDKGIENVTALTRMWEWCSGSRAMPKEFVPAAIELTIEIIDGLKVGGDKEKERLLKVVREVVYGSFCVDYGINEKIQNRLKLSINTVLGSKHCIKKT